MMDSSHILSRPEQFLKIPEIDGKSKRNNDPKAIRVERGDVEHLLQDFVRANYLKYVEGVLKENYKLWLKSDMGQISELVVTDEEIRKTAENIEIEAVKACMVVSLYRKAIIKMIDTIKSDTQQKLLNNILMKIKFNSKPNKKHVGVQTENIVPKRIPSPINIGTKKVKNTSKDQTSKDIDVAEATLDEKIRRFQQSFIETNEEIEAKPKEKTRTETKNQFYQIPGIIDTPTRPPMTPTINLNDLLNQQKQQKQEFFAPSTPNSVISHTPSFNLPKVPATPTCLLTPASTCTNSTREDDIDLKIMQELSEMFGDDEKDEAEGIFEEPVEPLQQVMKEIEAFGTKETNEKSEVAPLKLNQLEQSSEKSPIIDLKTLSDMKDPEEREKEIKEQLMSSVWPCELHHQRMRLRHILSDIAERNFRKYEKIKQRFRELFDDDESENELAPYSPSIELDEILIASCRKRISNWVVKSLMKPYKNGQIAKFLFKRLAKLLANNIIYQDQYPSEVFVKEYIYEYMCKHPRIECYDDMYTEEYSFK
uniref:CSON008365 protein n=1 Tax=Culicoides sonorensis TaxID=179676 RepID=A0A336M2D0_CULSO